MKKSVLFVFALIALIGVIHCTLIEPAFAYQDHCETSCQNETDCSACHFSSHQWIHYQDTVSASSFFPAAVVSHEIVEVVPNPPAELIFHPPIVL